MHNQELTLFNFSFSFFGRRTIIEIPNQTKCGFIYEAKLPNYHTPHTHTHKKISEVFFFRDFLFFIFYFFIMNVTKKKK